jgi:hypothetical protein
MSRHGGDATPHDGGHPPSISIRHFEPTGDHLFRQVLVAVLDLAGVGARSSRATRGHTRLEGRYAEQPSRTFIGSSLRERGAIAARPGVHGAATGVATGDAGLGR